MFGVWVLFFGDANRRNPLPNLSHSEVIELYTNVPEQIYQHVKPPAGLHPELCHLLNSCWRLPHLKRDSASQIVKKRSK